MCSPYGWILPSSFPYPSSFMGISLFLQRHLFEKSFSVDWFSFFAVARPFVRSQVVLLARTFRSDSLWLRKVHLWRSKGSGGVMARVLACCSLLLTWLYTTKTELKLGSQPHRKLWFTENLKWGKRRGQLLNVSILKNELVLEISKLSKRLSLLSPSLFRSIKINLRGSSQGRLSTNPSKLKQ